MHNIEFITENIELFLNNIKNRDITNELINEIDILKNLNLLRKENIKNIQNIEYENNLINSNQLPSIKKEHNLNESELKLKISELILTVNSNNEKIKKMNYDLQECEKKIKNILERIPNTILGSKNSYLSDFVIPIGDEDNNFEIRKWGEPRIFNDFEPLAHEKIGVMMKNMDFEQTSKISGSRFVTFSGKIAILEKALTNFMIDTHINYHGYNLFSVPYMVRPEAMYGVGQLPKFSEQSFIVSSGPEFFENDSVISFKDSYRLIPTAEVSLTNLVREKILNENELPIRMTAVTPCFRSEVGSGGRDVNGIIRMHQFSKVELVSIVKDDEAEKILNSDHNEIHKLNDINKIESELERMTFAACKILELLKLPYRVLVLASKDMGFSSRKTYDIEVWFPSQNRYREISSCSYCSDFQARRMNARYKNSITRKNSFVHTLNGSGVAVGRAIAAIIENYQTKDGLDFEIPEVLIKYMNNSF